ncbi:MAG: DUF5667 domain-containing protein [Candidatus Woesearchaeota archaeon]
MRKMIMMLAVFILMASFSVAAVEDENLTDEGDAQITEEEIEGMEEDIEGMDDEEIAEYIKEELGGPGITPDSRFYFMNNVLDMFKSSERIANERAAAVAMMAERGDEEALEKAMQNYERAMERRSEQSNSSEDEAESFANQSSKHLEVLSRVRDKVPEQARDSIGRAMERGAEGRERSIENLKKKNPERGQQVAERTLQRVMENAPEEAQQGLQRAFENVQKRMGKGPGEMSGGMPGNRSDLPGEADRMPGDEELPGEADRMPGNDTGMPGDEINDSENTTGAAGNAPDNEIPV